MLYPSYKTNKSRRVPLQRLASPFLTTALVLILGAAPVTAQDGSAVSGPVTMMMSDGQGGVAPTDSDGLLARAQSSGSLVVIVGFESGFAPEGAIDPAARASQRAAISTAQDQVVAALDNPQSVTRFESVPFVSMVVTPEDLERLLRLPGVTSITENIPSPPLLNESVPLIEANPSWWAGFTGEGWSVAVLDTGTQMNHRAFTHSIVAGACYSMSVAGRSSSVCPSGNDTQLGAWAGQNCAMTVAGCNHGTHVAGIATGDRSRRRGVAPDADLVTIQVFSRFDRSSDCGSAGAPCALSWSSDQVLGLERVLRLHDDGIVPQIASVNMSIGGGSYTANCDANNPALTAVISNLRSRGIATVIASGNNGSNLSISSPACVSTAVTVGSTTKTDEVSNFSNHNALVELLAPGSDISAPLLSRQPNRLTRLSGTSMAAPHVAGAWAVLRQAHPDASVDQVLRALYCTGEVVSRNGLPRPRINVDAARQFLDAPLNQRSWNFRNYNQFWQWTPHLGNWFWVAQRSLMRVRADLSQPWYVSGSPFCADNLRVDTRVRRVDTADDFHWNSGLLLSSLMDADANISGLLFAYNKANGGSAMIYAIDRIEGTTGNGSGRLLCNNSSANVNIGGYNNLSVISQNGFHRFLINGTEVCSATERAFLVGDVSVIMAAPENTPSHMFDIMRVSARALGSQASMTLAAGDPNDSAVPTAPGSYERAPEGGSLSVPAGVTPSGVSALN